MSAPLITLAAEALPTIQTSGAKPIAEELLGLIQAYMDAAMQDAEHAAERECGARGRLMSVQLGKLAGGAGEEDLAKTVDTARREVEAWAHDAAQAQADFEFAERRLERADRERAKGGERLSAEALKAFATERLRQIEEVIAGWTPKRPDRDRKLMAGLKRVFDALRRSAAGSGARAAVR